MTILNLLPILLALILLVPYEWGYRTDRHGHREDYWLSALYTYRYSPGYARLTLDGLRRLEDWLLLLLVAAATQMQPELIARLVAAIRHVLGL